LVLTWLSYERYLNIDDEEAIGHLKQLAPDLGSYTNFLQHLVLGQLQGQHSLTSNPETTIQIADPYSEPSISHINLFPEESDFVPAKDQLVLLFFAFGGCDIPDAVLRSVRLPQRRWNAEGEIENKTAAGFGLPADNAQLLSTDGALEEIMRTSGSIFARSLDDGTLT
jgi:hypothetical protein